MEGLSLQQAILITTLLINVLLAGVVYRGDRQSATNKLFACLGMVISLWLLATYFSVYPIADLWWTRITICMATLMSLLFFLLARIFPQPTFQMRTRWILVLCVVTGIVLAITLSPFAFTQVAPVNGVLTAIPGPGMAPFALLTTFFSGGAIFSFFKKFHSAAGNARRQLGFVIVGIVTMLGLVICTIMVPVIVARNDFFVQFAPLYTLFFLGMTAVAVLRYHLFDIKLVATETLVIILVLALLFEGLTEGILLRMVIKISFALLVAFLGIFLVRSVKKEIKQREQLAILNTSLEQANSSLKEANLRLQELDRQKTDFLSIASHQMRTPLSIFNGYMELLEDGAYGKITKGMLEVFRNIDENNQHLIKLVDEFLDITRIEQHRTKFTFTSLDIIAMINGVVKELTPKLRGKELVINWQPPTSPVMVMMDEEKIRHVIFNLVDNAIKYTEQGAVDVVFTERDEGIEVLVRDTGIGFDEQDQANFFQKFYRGNNVRGVNVTGTGLGLYVASKFIEGHSGKIWAKSPGLGKGGEFGFWIPKNPPPVPVEDTGEQSVVVSYSPTSATP